MKFVKLTVPQSGQNSNFIDTEGAQIVALTYFNVDVLDGTAVLKFQTPAPGQDPSNPSATWIDVMEISPGISTDADDAGTITAEQVRTFLGIPNLIFEGAGAARNHFYCVQKGNRIPKFMGAAASTAGHDAATAFAEADQQQLANQVARLSNQFPASALGIPRILRVNVGANQTTAAVDFWLGLAEPVRTVPNPNPRSTTVAINNGEAFSTFFELQPGEKLVGIATPAAFTTTDLTLETPKLNSSGVPLDPSVGTDANWLAVSEYVTEQTVLTGSLPEAVFKWSGAAQGLYLTVPELNAIELPRFLRLKGSGNQGAARTVTLFIQ